MNELYVFIILIILFYLYIFYIRKSIYLVKVTSNLNNETYFVRDLPDKQDAADLLAKITQDFKKLISGLPDNPANNRLKNNFSNNITENIPGSLYVAYSINKGDELSLCLRNEDNSFIETNTIMFVAIHEIAHIMTLETGHTDKFWDNMKYLLDKATEINIYYPVDYSKVPTEYCGMTIDSTPQ